MRWVRCRRVTACLNLLLYVARLPVDLGGEQHPSRLIRARLPRGGKAEHAQARQRRQHLRPVMLPYAPHLQPYMGPPGRDGTVGGYTTGSGLDSGAHRDEAHEDCEPKQAQQEAMAAVRNMVLSKDRSGGRTETQQTVNCGSTAGSS